MYLSRSDKRYMIGVDKFLTYAKAGAGNGRNGNGRNGNVALHTNSVQFRI